MGRGVGSLASHRPFCLMLHWVVVMMAAVVAVVVGVVVVGVVLILVVVSIGLVLESAVHDAPH